MNYREILDWMFTRLPMYQRQGASAYKIDLNATIRLATYLGDPHKNFKCIHVGGTNGKGSTSHMLASVLQEAGYRVGLYTSPHLKDFRERIRINGNKVSKEYVIDFIQEHQPYFETNQLSFFEMTVGMAFQYFSMSKVDIAVIEVGLGGRLDSTNIVTPEVSVITNIGLDHTEFLGDTLTKIAIEKAGIIKQNKPVVIGKATSETKHVFIEKAKLTSSDLYFASEYAKEGYTTDLKGNYQKENVKTVLQAIAVLKSRGWKLNDKHVQKGLNSVTANTGLLGRWQILNEQPKVICDTAHNIDGLQMVLHQLQQETYETLHMVMGLVANKNLEAILPLFPDTAVYYFTKPNISRGLNEKFLRKQAEKFGLVGKDYPSVAEAYHTALQKATKKDVIYIGGSTFVVAEII
ncbi:bifunctional folylpolyglutamate synthase/dihydrofolate synthase [Aquimarina sp. U1-2]|uniref:bifunctional folylpolyglutamate synthase/dihydrofolate synthase n=1 Tax=Aquimarina sp. U1-2 TaxID=2823141 RepID=UPI001AECACAE|nr:folylpolyglutamate synthase/dihydrofolate synthase family protein [Aquimarina sp. U1-2]MBP2831105.1 bifunctional folylpolyglutamate synthase/dihydrofolate synthase [Aquimarina sp. U1-2]